MERPAQQIAEYQAAKQRFQWRLSYLFGVLVGGGGVLLADLKFWMLAGGVGIALMVTMSVALFEIWQVWRA